MLRSEANLCRTLHVKSGVLKIFWLTETFEWMRTEEVFEVFVMSGGYTRTNLCKEKFKLREG